MSKNHLMGIKNLYKYPFNFYTSICKSCNACFVQDVLLIENQSNMRNEQNTTHYSRSLFLGF